MTDASTLALRSFLLAAGYTAGTVLARYTHAATTRDVQTYETAAWSTVYELTGGQTVDVTLRLNDRFNHQARTVKFNYVLAAVEIEDNCRALFCGVAIPGCVEAPHVPKPTAREQQGWYTELAAFAARPEVELTQAGVEVLAIVADHLAQQAAEQARAEAEKAAYLAAQRIPQPGQEVVFHNERGALVQGHVTSYYPGYVYCAVRLTSGATAFPRLHQLTYLAQRAA